MNGMTKRMKTALFRQGHTQLLMDGTVKPRTFAFDFEDVPVIVKAFRRMVRNLDFDISEMAMTTYLCARAHGKPFTAIPVFPWRGFHHGAIVYNTTTGVRTPRDLEGRRVGVNRGYTVTTGLWARGILQHEHGVDLRKVTWVLSGDEHVAEYQPPPNVVPIEPGKTLEELLLTGDVVAANGVQTDSPIVKPLIPNARETALAAARDRGFYPINHTIVIRNDVLAVNPELAPDLFNAFAEAKRLYLPRLRTGAVDPMTPVDRDLKAAMDVVGDPLPYGVEPNRAMLETIVRYSVEQGVLKEPVAIEELFVPSTLALTA